jgi:tetratricopeptide (TPR) repeat protein
LFGTFQKIFKQKPDELTPEVSQALDRLVNYGLLQWVGKGYEVTHPLIHSFARQRLAAPDGATKRLVNYYTTLVGEQILLGLDGYTRLDTERPHFIGLITRTIEQKDWESAHNLAAAIEDYLDLQGHWAERVITNEAGLLAAHNLGLHNESSWLGSLGLVYSNGGQPERAIEYYEQALTLARKHNDRRSEGNWLGNMGLAYRDLAQFDLARQYLEQAIAIFDDIQSPSADLIRDWLAEFEDE